MKKLQLLAQYETALREQGKEIEKIKTKLKNLEGDINTYKYHTH